MGSAGFRHEALFYAGDAEFVARLTPFIREGVERREPVLVVVPGHKIGWLRDSLGADAKRVTFADMADVGRNPARIIPVWRRFLAATPHGGLARGVGEPAHSERTADELVECRRHETLLNLAFEDSGDWSLVCPYDTATLPREVVAAALGTHPWVDGRGSMSYGGTDLPDDPLPVPPPNAFDLAFTAGPLEVVHAFVRTHAEAAGLPPQRVDDLLLAVHELVANSLRHAGGSGTVLFWTEGGYAFAEVRDDGRIADPLAGRWDPTTEQENGRGLWIVNQLCDLTEVRSTGTGTVVRVRMSLDAEVPHATVARRLR